MQPKGGSSSNHPSARGGRGERKSSNLKTICKRRGKKDSNFSSFPGKKEELLMRKEKR